MKARVLSSGAARVAAGLLATGLAVAALGSTAAADPMNPTTPEDGLWYFYQTHLDEIHASGITGTGVTIAILDGPINLEVPTLQGANLELKDSFCYDASGAHMPGTSNNWDLATHGTEIASLVVGTGAGYPGGIGVKGVAPGAKVLYYPDYTSFDLGSQDAQCYDKAGAPRPFADGIASAIEDAVANGAQIISMSFVTAGSDHMESAIATALRAHVILVAGLGNHEGNTATLDSPPGTSNGVISVLSAASDGSLQLIKSLGTPNTSPYVDVVAPGVNILEQGGATSKDWTKQSFAKGTSEATPIVAGELALVVQKYPDATPNQILQSLIHNTGSEPHAVERDATYGYGAVSPRSLVAADPTQYEDVNPFVDPAITDDDPNGPSVAEIAGTTAPTSSPTSGATPQVTSSDPGTTVTDSSSLLPLLIVGGLVLLLIIAVIVIVVTVAARKPGKGPNHG